MSKWQKLIQKVLKGKSDITPADAQKILESYGYVATPPSGGSSHLTYRKNNRPSVTIVITQNPLKPYMIDKLQNVINIEEA